MMKVLLMLSLLIFCACSKKQDHAESKYTSEELLALAHEASVSNEKGEDAIKFSDYAPGVDKLESKSFRYQRLVFYAIKFESTDEAKSEAMRLNQYYSRNWLFDRVEGEPVLEDYVITAFKAQNPNRKIQRKPKKPNGHGDGQGEAHGNAHGEAPAHH